MGIGRLSYVILGTIAGLSCWVMTDRLPDLWEGRLALVATVLVVGFFGPALAMAAELRLRPTLLFAAVIALPLGVLVFTDSLGFPTARAFLETGHVLFAAVLLGALPVPFLIGIGQQGRAGWNDYPALFMSSWNIVVRYAAALMFVAVVWLVLVLSSELLQLVGIDALKHLLREEAVIWMLSGAVLGLGLAVVTDLPDLISPYLLLRLLRLLLPVVLIVVAVFVAALPFRGLDRLFGHLSATGILVGVAAAAVALISITVDQDDIEGAHDRLLPPAARLLALFLPVLAGLAVWALVLRVGQYGWTPVRVSAAASVFVTCGYALLYTLAVLAGRGWMGLVRRANLAMALVLIALSALWLTPLISPERIAVRSQMARFEAGQLPVGDLPLWELAHDWGTAGAHAVAGLRQRAQGAGQEDLAARLVQLDTAEGSWEMRPAQAAAPDRDAIAAARKAFLVAPQGAALPDGLFDNVGARILQGWLQACEKPTPAAHAGCLVVLADMLPDAAGEEAVILLNHRQLRALSGAPVLLNGPAGWQQSAFTRALSGAEISAGDLIDSILREGFSVLPSGINALDVGGHSFVASP